MKKQRGFVLPVSLCVAGVVLFLGASTAQMSAGDLQVSSHLFYQERARQVADFGLEAGVHNNITAATTFAYNGVTQSHSGDSAQVSIYDNRNGDLPADSGCPVTVPPGFQYWVSTGQARNESGTVLASVRRGALVRWGMPLGAAGAQVHYLHTSLGTAVGPGAVVKFVAVHGNSELPSSHGRILCATEATNGDLPIPNPHLDLVKPLTFGQVQSFDGKVKIPQGTTQSQLIQSSQPLEVETAGGLFNIPSYAPPLASQFFASVTPESGDLPPGEYQELVLSNNANLTLNGSYHFKTLRLTSGGGQLSVGESGSANVFVDRLEDPDDLHLRLSNQQPASAAFRLNLQPADSTSSLPPPVKLQIASDPTRPEGGVAVSAPYHHLKIISSGRRVIRGSFACEMLSLAFAPGGDPAKFAYDITADTTRSGGAPDTRTSVEPVVDPPTEEYHAVDQPMILSKNDL